MTDLISLKQITRMQYDRQSQAFHKVVAEEAAIRAELARIEVLDVEARAAADSTHRALGADVLWQGWVARSKTALNMRLARTLAIKDRHRLSLSRAYGRVTVIDELIKKERAERKRRFDRAALDRAIAGSLR